MLKINKNESTFNFILRLICSYIGAGGLYYSHGVFCLRIETGEVIQRTSVQKNSRKMITLLSLLSHILQMGPDAHSLLKHEPESQTVKTTGPRILYFPSDIMETDTCIYKLSGP